ncbi:MAG: hypothetical protein WC934_14880 [Acidithiobacillus sp.]|jgi:hypothetical protein|uniref:hypothetical protein n=1 Tax=Acidithiobacillus sp. TaxID=1872118 RepID=UPI00355F9E2D
MECPLIAEIKPAVSISNSFEKNMNQKELDKLFSKFLLSQNGHGTWEQKINKIVIGKYNKAKSLYDIHDESDLFQNVLCMLFNFFCNKKFEIVNEKMLSSLVYKIADRSLKLIARERYYNKRKILINNTGRSVHYKDRVNGFDDIISDSDRSGSRISDIMSSDSVDSSAVGIIIDAYTIQISNGKNIDDRLYFESLINECKKRMNSLQYEIFFRCFVKRDKTLSDIAIKYGYTTSNIIQIKTRHIIPIVKNVMKELSNG